MPLTSDPSEPGVRAAAHRVGLRLIKRRSRIVGALDPHAYWLADLDINALILGGEWGTTLADCADLIRERQLD